MPDTTYSVPGGTSMKGYLATPSTPGPWPGVVVIHEGLGLRDDMRRQADRLADNGYVAFAPDLFSYGSTPRCVLATFRTAIRGGGGPALGHIDAARDFVLGQPGSTGKVGIIGFCMGGAFAILAANRGFDVAAPNYGLVRKDAERALRGACPMVGSFGRRDLSLRGAAGRLETALAANGIVADVKEYPHAGHAFMTHEAATSWLFTRVPNLGYVEDAAADAWGRVLAFFDAHLRAAR